MKFFLSLSLILSLVICFGQSNIEYKLDLKNIHHHELGVEVTFKDIIKDTLEIRMPNASPGRYAVHHFAKNVYGETATDSKGNLLILTRTSPSS